MSYFKPYLWDTHIFGWGLKTLVFQFQALQHLLRWHGLQKTKGKSQKESERVRKSTASIALLPWFAEVAPMPSNQFIFKHQTESANSFSIFALHFTMSKTSWFRLKPWIRAKTRAMLKKQNVNCSTSKHGECGWNVTHGECLECHHRNEGKGAEKPVCLQQLLPFCPQRKHSLGGCQNEVRWFRASIQWDAWYRALSSFLFICLHLSCAKSTLLRSSMVLYGPRLLGQFVAFVKQPVRSLSFLRALSARCRSGVSPELRSQEIRDIERCRKDQNKIKTCQKANAQRQWLQQAKQFWNSALLERIVHPWRRMQSISPKGQTTNKTEDNMAAKCLAILGESNLRTVLVRRFAPGIPRPFWSSSLDPLSVLSVLSVCLAICSTLELEAAASTVLQHFGVSNLWFSMVFVTWWCSDLHVGWYFATRVHLGLVYVGFKAYYRSVWGWLHFF